MAAYVRNICADGEECQPLPGTYKEPECYILRSVNELEDPMPIKHKQGYLAICCISAGLSIIQIGQSAYLNFIRNMTSTTNGAFNTFLDSSRITTYGWWGALIALCAAACGIAAVVQPKSQKAFVLAACIVSGIAMVVVVLSIVVESKNYTDGARIAACAYKDGSTVNAFGKSDDGSTTKAQAFASATTASANSCFCVNGPGFGTYTGLQSVISGDLVDSNCTLPMSLNDRLLSSICVGAFVWGIVVCHFVYSIILLVEQPPVSIADDKGMMVKSVNAPSMAEPSVPTLKV